MPTARAPAGGAREVLLLPVKPWFIALSLLVALLIDFLPLGRLAWMPDLVALTLVFWNVHQPRRVGMAVAFVLGLAVDVQQGSVLGQHALAYTVLSYFAISLHRRLLWFPPLQQALHVLPLLVATQLLLLLVGMWAGGSFPGWMFLLTPFLQAALWAPLSWVLLAPQRRAPDSDRNRPL
ncbi:rod shape-determining protein MreD [Thiomonas intermedia]|uniref:rod shape-determining protein MreD n=1 Tax=Thiomonas intermedia TaxID=926 RepID=UPI0009A502A9|nr:rod shape-determining protein MreD [Thiomonas intermedia]